MWVKCTDGSVIDLQSLKVKVQFLLNSYFNIIILSLFCAYFNSFGFFVFCLYSLFKFDLKVVVINYFLIIKTKIVYFELKVTKKKS